MPLISPTVMIIAAVFWMLWDRLEPGEHAAPMARNFLCGEQPPNTITHAVAPIGLGHAEGPCQL